MGPQKVNNGHENDGDSTKKTMEEEIYWTNFKSIRFFLFLFGDFLNQLVIPKKFAEKMKDKLPQTMVLKGPGGATSEVRLVKDHDHHGSLYFKDGWKEFAIAHHFMENDLLVFKYKRDSCFKVWKFDRRSMCENAGSYFVRKSDSKNKSAGENSLPKRKSRKSSVDVGVEEEDLDVQVSDSECAPVGSSRRKGRRQSVSGLWKCDVKVKSPSAPDIPGRRQASAEDKDRALRMAISESTNESFLVPLKGTSVAQTYRLCIPAGWARNHLTSKHQDIELRVKEKKWTVRYNTLPRSGGGVLVSGWCKFVQDNSLQESDVCLFKLCSPRHEPAIIDVKIFYAGEKVVKQ